MTIKGRLGRKLLAGLAALFVLPGCSTRAQAPHADQLRMPPGIRWAGAPQTDAGIDLAAINALYTEMEYDTHHDLKGVVIVRDGRLVSEHYFNGDTASTLHDIRSATKSITSLLMGIAIAQGKVRGVENPIADYLPGLPHDGKEKIRIQDLLTMRSGLDADDDDPKSPGNEDRLDESSDWIRALYAVPMKREPGAQYLYCSANAFLTGAIVENATHQPLDQFAKANLFAPLGIPDFRWRHVPVNRITGQGNLEIRTRDMAAIGEMVRNGGAVAGHSIVPKQWIDDSTASRVAIGNVDPFSDSYGYMWYTRAEPVNGATVTVHFASGNGGNKIYVVPSLHMVVAISSSAYGTSWGQRRSQNILLKVLASTHP